MLGRSVMFTPNGFVDSFRVSRIATRRASGLDCVRAVRIPKNAVRWKHGESGDKRTKSACVGYGGSELRMANPVQKL